MSVETESLWTSFLQEVRTRIRPQQYQTWFSNLRMTSMEPGRLVVRAPSEFLQTWLQENYMDTIRAAASAVMGEEPDVEFVIDKSISLPPEPDVQPESEVAAVSRLAERQGFRLNDLYTFDNFVVGPSNRIAHAACRAISRAPGADYNPLFLHGSVGLGKSHLLQAACHALLKTWPRYRIRYLSCEQFVNEFISAIQRNELLPFRERYRGVDALMIDDIQFITRGERSQEEFFHTFNTLYNAQKQIVLTADTTPGEMGSLEERLISRFKCGLVARLDPPHYETRVAILQKKAVQRRIELAPDVIHFVASRVTSNIRELEGAITKIVGHAALDNLTPDLELAREALHEPGNVTRSVTIEDILGAICGYFNVRVADLQSKKRHKSIAFPRQICMHLARCLTNHSLEEIGGYFGGRDHTTVMYADTKIRNQAKTDIELQRTLGYVMSELERVGN